MAAIVNARDLLLQAASPRVSSVTMASHIKIDQSNVTGLGLIVSGTRLALMQASTQVFQVSKSGVISPASSVIAVTLKNMTVTPELTVVAGTLSVNPSLVNGYAAIQGEHLTSDSVTLRVTAISEGVTYTDEITLVKVREGVDALVGFLTNESHAVPADYLGNVTNYEGASGTFKVFFGITDITAQCGFSVVNSGNPVGLTYTLGASNGNYLITGAMPTTTEVTTLTMQAAFGTARLVKTFTLSKVRLPESARSLSLSASSQVFQILKSGTINPAAVTFTSSTVGLGGYPTFSVTPANVLITSTPYGNTCVLTYAGMGDNETAQVTVSQGGLTDTITVVKIREGADGLDYILTVESDKGTVFKLGQALQMTLLARVFKNGVEITDDLLASRFRWRRSSYYPRAAPNDDASWNAQFSSGYKQITITTNAVEHRATFMCDLLN